MPVIISIKRLNWSNGITLTNKTTVKDLTNYINFKINEYTKYNFKINEYTEYNFKINEYTKYNFKDKSLWDLYQKDFNNFTV
jgi:hypothetical protein